MIALSLTADVARASRCLQFTAAAAGLRSDEYLRVVTEVIDGF
jgi:hypothetical protein